MKNLPVNWPAGFCPCGIGQWLLIPPGGMQKEDWGRKEDGHPTVDIQFDDATVEGEEDKEEVIVELEEEVVVESGTEEKLEQPVVREPLAEELGEATIDPGNQEVVRSHAGEDDL